MTSKFFAAGNASSDSESSEEEVKINKNLRKTKNVQRDLQSSDSDEKRKVVGQKEKKWLLMKKYCQKIKDKLKINDFSEVNSNYQELMKQIDKSKNLVEKQGYPSFYMKLVIHLIEYVSNFDGKSKLNAINGKQFTKLKQKLKKYEKDFEEQIEAFKNKKEESDKEEDKSKKNKKSFNEDGDEVSGEGDDGDNNDDEDSDEDKKRDVDSDSDSSEDDKSPLDSTDPMIRRKYWMKKKPEKDSKEKIKEDKLKKAEEDKQKQKQKIKLKEKKIEADIKGKKFKLVETKERITTFTSEDAKKTLHNALKQIGKSIDEEGRQWILTDIANILDNMTNDAEIISSLLVQIPFIFDTSKSPTKSHFKRSDWRLGFEKLSRVYKIIHKSKDDALLASIESFQQDAYTPEMVLRFLINFLNTLHQQLKKALMYTEVSDLQYYERLQDLLKLIDLNYKLLRLYEQRCDIPEYITLLASLLLENTYHFSADSYQKLQRKYEAAKQQVPAFIQLKNPETFINIGKLALQDTDKESKIRNVLYVVYNHAIYGRDEGRKILLTSNIIDNIHSYSYVIQTLFNRVLVQLGINSFIDGNLYQVQNTLSDICSTMRTRQLLAQGSLKQEQAQQHRRLPFHLHLNIDVIQSAELISSMLNEMPYFFKHGGRITSKTFKRIYDIYQRSHFIAEPLSSKDIIYSAAKELQKSNWKECYQKLVELDFWKHLRNAETAKANILKRIKEQALKCYLLANQVSFSTLKISNLQQKFEIDCAQQVNSIINRLIFYGDLNAAATLDGFIKFYHVQTNKMDKIIESLCEKAQELVSTNESNLKTRLGTRGNNQDEELARENILELRRNNRRGVGSERNKLLGVKKVVIAQKKVAQ